LLPATAVDIINMNRNDEDNAAMMSTAIACSLTSEVVCNPDFLKDGVSIRKISHYVAF
jgi:UDP-glucose 6-dehydrogenase